MADTIITTPSSAPAENSSAGWVIAVILLIALIGAGAYAWTHYGARVAQPAPTGGAANINVTLPTGDAGGDQGGTPAAGDTGGDSTGGSAGGAAY